MTTRRGKGVAVGAPKAPHRKPSKPKSAKSESAARVPVVDSQKPRRGRPSIDPAKLAARGSYVLNPRRAPKNLSALTDLKGKPKVILKGSAAEAVSGVKRDYVAVALQYAGDVVAGKVLVCKLARAACERHLADLERSKAANFPYYFDAAAANTFVENAERYPHIKGKWAAARELFKASPDQCFILCVAFGWKRKVNGRRRFREMYVSVPRKNGKSTLAAVIGNNMLVSDGEHGAEVYAGATTEKQAWEVFGPARLMFSRSPDLAAQFGVEVWAKALVKTEDNSRFWPVIGKPGDGASPHCAIVDEYHEHTSSDLLDTMVTGMGAREQPMVLIITTAGTNLASPCYDKHIEAKNVLEGTIVNEELFAMIHGIDDTDDWTSPEVIRKSNPNIGISADEEFLLAQQRQATQNSAYQNRFKTKHLNVWCSASVAGINLHQWRQCADTSLRIEQFHGEVMWGALDLASKVDICSYARVFKKMVNGENHYYAFTRSYLPEAAVEEATKNQLAYRKWALEGRLILSPGAEIDFDQVREDVLKDAEKYVVQEIIYDPWRATQLAHQLAKEGARVVEMGQSAKNMGEAYDELLTAVKVGRFHHDGDPVLEWMAANVVSKTVAKGLVVPSKDRTDQKIDGIVAVTMAVARAMVTEIGSWLENPISVG